MDLLRVNRWREQLRKMPEENQVLMKRGMASVVLCVLALPCASCGGKTATQSTPENPRPAPAPIPTEIEKAGEAVLGSEAEVLAFGDLARTGRQQFLAVNRLKKTPPGTVPGILVTRAAVAENVGGAWKEVFLCDEHLKNPNGYLGATPIAPVPTWRLQYEQSPEKGLVMYFTPLEKPAGGYMTTIGVRWNPKVNRYQSLERNFEHFLGEVPALEEIPTRLRR